MIEKINSICNWLTITSIPFYTFTGIDFGPALTSYEFID